MIRSVLADASNPDFLFAGEACYDREFMAYQLSYHRSESVRHIPLSRYLRPYAPLMTAVTGFDDRNMINQCLLYRYVISYEPYNFKGRLTDIPLTIDYGRKMDAAREELRDWFWDGTFQDTRGARVVNSDTGTAHHPYAVYRHAGNESLGVVVANYDADDDVAVDIALDEVEIDLAYRLLEDGAWSPISGPVRIPPRSVAIVVPAGATR